MNDAELNTIIDDMAALLPSFFRMLKKIRNDILADREMANVHIQILFTLKNEGPQNMSALGKKIVASKPNVTVFVNKLITLGYAERFYDPSDRRIVAIRLTGEGLKFLENYYRQMKEYFRRMIAEYTESDLSLLRLTLDNVKNLTDKYMNLKEK